MTRPGVDQGGSEAAVSGKTTLIPNPHKGERGEEDLFGDVVVRIDAHAMVPRDYVRTGVVTLEETGADNVGGVMAAEGTTDFERTVARAMTSRFGVGGASFHVGGEPGEADT